MFGLLLIIILAYIGPGYLDRVSSAIGPIDADRPTNDRLVGLIHGITMMIKRPVLGVGIGCYAEARSYYFGYYLYSHNLYGEIIGELGLGRLA